MGSRPGPRGPPPRSLEAPTVSAGDEDESTDSPRSPEAAAPGPGPGVGAAAAEAKHHDENGSGSGGAAEAAAEAQAGPTGAAAEAETKTETQTDAQAADAAGAAGGQIEVPREDATPHSGTVVAGDGTSSRLPEDASVHVPLDGDEPRAEPRVLAAIPAYNEEVAIGSVVLQVQDHVDDVVVIDDGSDDRTSELADEAGADVIAFEDNHGKGHAVKAAFEVARMGGYDALVLLDGDGQHLPEQIPDLVGPVLGRGPHEDDPVDMTVGLRFGDNTEMPLYRRFGKRVLDYATALASTATSGKTEGPTDSQTGFRAFNADAIETMADKLQGNGFGIESEQILVAEENGLETASVAITCRYEDIDESSTKGPIQHGLSVLDSVVRMATMRRPLVFMGIPSVLLMVAGGGLGIFVLQYWNWTGYFSVPQAMGAGFLILLGMLGVMSSLILNVMVRFTRSSSSSREPD